jgi:hypothetical protein
VLLLHVDIVFNIEFIIQTDKRACGQFYKQSVHLLFRALRRQGKEQFFPFMDLSGTEPTIAETTIEIQRRNPRAFPIEYSTHNSELTLVRTELSNS